MDSPQHREELLRQLAALERQVVCLRAQLCPQLEPPAREPFTAIGVELGASRYALATAMIHKIIPIVAWHGLPEAPRWVLGVFRYRGQTLLLIDLHRRLLEVEVPLTTSMVILVTKPPNPVGLLASGVSKLIRVGAEEITAPPTDVSYASFITGSIAGANGQLMHILSVPRLRREFVIGPEQLAAHTPSREESSQ